MLANICQKRKWVIGIVMRNNLSVAYDKVMLRALRAIYCRTFTFS